MKAADCQKERSALTLSDQTWRRSAPWKASGNRLCDCPRTPENPLLRRGGCRSDGGRAGRRGGLSQQRI